MMLDRRPINNFSYIEILILVVSFFLAMCLSILPLPYWANYIVPPWVVLILIFWSVYSPHLVGILSVWCIGIILDVLFSSLLGQHALALIVVYFMIAPKQQRFKSLPIWAQALKIAVLVMVYQLIIVVVQLYLGEFDFSWLFLLSPVTSMFLWPCIMYLME